MNLVRKIKIKHLIALIGVDKEIYEFIESTISYLTPFKMDKYPKSTFHMNSEGKYILEQNTKNDKLWVRYYDFWEILESKYKLKYIEIQIIIKYMVEEAFKIKALTLNPANQIDFSQVEENFKNKVSTPLKTYIQRSNSVKKIKNKEYE